MLIKLGVDISRLNRKIRRALRHVDEIFKKLGCEAVITSTYEGNHSPSSLHYTNDAFDVRYCPSRDGILTSAKIRGRLGDDFDVVDEEDHIHIEYDPN